MSRATHLTGPLGTTTIIFDNKVDVNDVNDDADVDVGRDANQH